MTQEAIREHQMAKTGGTTTDLFQCSKCKKKNCTYNQVRERRGCGGTGKGVGGRSRREPRGEPGGERANSPGCREKGTSQYINMMRRGF